MTIARTGRPKLDNPRSEGVYIRLTKEEHADVAAYAELHNLSITQTLVQGFYSLKNSENKNE